MNDRNNLIIPFSILGIAFLISVIIFSLAFKASRTELQTITVTGSSTKPITSDFAILRGSIEVREASAKEAYRELQNKIPILVNYLTENGFPKDSIDFSTVRSYPVYEMSSQGYQTQNILVYVYNQGVEVKSDDVNKIKELSQEISSLIEKGVNFNVEQPEYHYSKIDDLKIEMQAAAAKNAMERAAEISKATGRDLGALRKARMGVIQITPRNSNMVSDYGYNDTGSIEKEITAVVSATFELD